MSLLQLRSMGSILGGSFQIHFLLNHLRYNDAISTVDAETSS